MLDYFNLDIITISRRICLTAVSMAADEFTLVNHNGDHVTSGGLVLFNGGTVCDDGFNDNAAVAICRKMGYDGSHAAWRVMEDASGTAWNIQNNYDTHLDDIDCSGESWSDCRFDARSEDCNHIEDIFLSCRGSGKVIL